MTKFICPNWDADWDSRIDKEAFKRNACLSYKKAMESAKSKVVEIDDVKRWHHIMFRGLVPLSYYAGNFRQNDALRPCLGIDVEIGMHLGDSFDVVIRNIEALFARTRESISIVELGWGNLDPQSKALRLAVIIGSFIGAFIKIHPFVNGNGRASRLLWAAALIRFGVSAQCRIHPRPHESTPYGVIMEAAMTGDFRPVQLAVLMHLAINRPNICS